MEHKTNLCLNFEQRKTLVISCALEAGAPFSQSSKLYYEKLHSLTVKNVIIWYKFLLLFDRILSELLEQNLTYSLVKVLKLS